MIAESPSAATGPFAHLPYGNLLDPRAAHDCALDLQERVDASAFAFDGINFWMLVRQFLFMQSARLAGETFTALFGTAGHSGRVFDATDAPPETVLRGVHTLTEPDSSLIAAGPIDINAIRGGLLFVEVPADYTQHLGAYAVNAYADPVLRHFRGAGETVAKLCRYQRRLLVKPKLEPPIYFTPAPARLSQVSPDAIELRRKLEEVNRALAGLGLPHRLDARNLFGDIGLVLAARNAARVWLYRIRPEMVFLQNYSNTEKMGIIAAARERGIPTIDLMHGIQDRGNIYHDHPEPRPDQIYLYPDSLWVWGDATRRALKVAEARPGAAWRHIAKAGYAWRDAYRGLLVDPRKEALRRLIPPGRRVVLYCHDASLHDDAFEHYLPETVLEAIRNDGKDLFWLIRIHPRSFHLHDEIATYLRGLGLVNFELLLSCECNLYDLFDLADIALVKYSVAGLEAASAGLPVITHHAVGARTFAGQIASGHIAFAPTSADIAALARSMPPPATPLDYVESGPHLLDRALAETRAFFGSRRAD